VIDPKQFPALSKRTELSSAVIATMADQPAVVTFQLKTTEAKLFAQYTHPTSAILRDRLDGKVISARHSERDPQRAARSPRQHDRRLSAGGGDRLVTVLQYGSLPSDQAAVEQAISATPRAVPQQASLRAPSDLR